MGCTFQSMRGFLSYGCFKIYWKFTGFSTASLAVSINIRLKMWRQLWHYASALPCSSEGAPVLHLLPGRNGQRPKQVFCLCPESWTLSPENCFDRRQFYLRWPFRESEEWVPRQQTTHMTAVTFWGAEGEGFQGFWFLIPGGLGGPTIEAAGTPPAVTQASMFSAISRWLLPWSTQRDTEDCIGDGTLSIQVPSNVGGASSWLIK